MWCLGSLGSGGTVDLCLSLIVTSPWRSFAPIHRALVLCLRCRFCEKAVGSRMRSRHDSL